METKNLYNLTVKNIRQAIDDYRRHTNQVRVLDDVSDDFIHRLAVDSINAKSELRNLFRKSPVWDENLQALVINGTRTHNTDYGRIESLATEILHDKLSSVDTVTYSLIRRALMFFTDPDYAPARSIDAIKKLAPKAYAPTKKKSRIFKAFCDALGVSDDTAGSQFQKLYAQIADEMSSRKIDFKLYVSINPAHFLTMSNPKNDERGDTLTSCHSFNSTEYEYNNGCVGYARDDVTMIVFTASAPSKPETLNNRKTTRQLFMYKVGNGLLLQSRMYNTFGGTRGEQSESALYRDLIQREISSLENKPNLWRTRNYHGSGISIKTNCRFGGYPDWKYEDFVPKISIREDHKTDFKEFEVGAIGLCIACGREITEGLYCRNCSSGFASCERCGEYGFDEDDLYLVHNASGEIEYVCEYCRDDFYRICSCCEEYYPNRCITDTADGEHVCDSCLQDHYVRCEDCGEYVHFNNSYCAVDAHCFEYVVCNNCREENYYEECDDCGRVTSEEYLTPVYDQRGNKINVCRECRRSYETCAECGNWFQSSTIEDSLCNNCRNHNHEGDEVT